MHVNTCKFFQNIYCACVSLYKHNTYTQYTHIYTAYSYKKKLILDVINRCPARYIHCIYLSIYIMSEVTHPSVAGEQDGVALDVSVYDALCVQVRQRLQHRQTDGGDLLLIHPVNKTSDNHQSSQITCFSQAPETNTGARESWRVVKVLLCSC